MKQVININFQGRVVPIEVTAFEVLKAYTESLNRYFANEDGKEEIINDIENRIGELFQERLKAGSTCITDDDVNAIIRSMGRPEDLETEEIFPGLNEQETSKGPSTTYTGAAYNAAGHKRLFRDENDKVIGGVCSGLANYFGIDVVIVRIIFVILGVSFGFGLITYLVLWIAVPSTASTEIGGVRKKLYRDSDNKFIGGVCSGIANYFGVNVWIPRVLFLLPALTFASKWSRFEGDFPDLIRVGFSPGALIVYIILWLVIPEAVSTAEKLEMKGEKVDMNSIKNSVLGEMKGVQQRAEKFGREATTFANERAKTFTAEVGGAAKKGGRSLGDIIVLLFKIFIYFILGVMGFAFVMALFGLGIAAVGIFPMKDYILTDGWQNVFAWGTLIFFIAVPIIGIITWVIRRLAKIKSNRKAMRMSFLGLWFIGLFSFIALVVSVSRDFRASNTLTEQEVALANPAVNKLELTAISPTYRFARTRWFRMEPFQTIDEDTALVKNISVHIVKSPTDSFRVTMVKLVNGRNRRYADTLASKIIFDGVQQDSLLILDQGIAITRNDKFRNQRIVLTVYVPVGKEIRIDKSLGHGYNINFGSNSEWDVEWGDIEHGWEHDVNYIMRADGLYDKSGNRASDYSPDTNDFNNFENRRQDGVDMTDGNYRYPGDSNRVDSSKMKQKEGIKKDTKDSIPSAIKQSAKIEKHGVEKYNEDMVYAIPAYSPMLILF